MKEEEMKFALVSHVMPGQSAVLYYLLRDLDPNMYCLITNKTCEAHNSIKEAKLLNAKCFKVQSGLWVSFSERFNRGLLLPMGIVMGLFDVFIAPFNIIFRAFNIASILKKEKCKSVIACTADFSNLPAAYLASLVSGCRYYPYLLDYYSYQWTQPFVSSLAQFIEPILLKNASGVIVPNEQLSEDLSNRYGIESLVIHNPFDISAYDDIIKVPWPAESEEVRIVYTGAIYQAHFDAFRNLVSALDKLNFKNINLHIYSSRTQAQLEKDGIKEHVVYHGHVEHRKSIEEQRRADILFLPLAFNSIYPNIIRTSSPGKIGEYLASGRPILVHAPADSFICGYFKKNNCGIVVDSNDIDKLSQAIMDIVRDEELRKNICTNAEICAKRDFNIENVRPKFLDLLRKDY